VLNTLCFHGAWQSTNGCFLPSPFFVLHPVSTVSLTSISNCCFVAGSLGAVLRTFHLLSDLQFIPIAVLIIRRSDVPVVIFWTIQVYTVYGASFREAGVYLLPIGFCIAGGAVISAVLMTVFKKKSSLFSCSSASCKRPVSSNSQASIENLLLTLSFKVWVLWQLSILITFMGTARTGLVGCRRSAAPQSGCFLNH
jgi:hypothetical protein